MNPSPTTTRVRRVRHDLLRHEVRVHEVARISPGFIAVTLGGPTLGRLVSLSFDDHIKFLFQDPSGQEHRRDYTPRHCNPDQGEVTLEFALHEGGLASDWARRARVGDAAVIAGPKGSMIAPDDLDWYLLAGDATALPAIARRLEEVPPGTQVLAFVQLDSGDDARALQTRADLRLHWLASADALCEAVRAQALPPGEGFAWCAGEASLMVRLRDILQQTHGVAHDHLKVSAYWKRGAADFHEHIA